MEEGRATTIRDEHETQGFAGRFGAGLPRINDGSLPVPPAHDLEDEAAPRRAARRVGDRLQRLAAVHRRAPARASPRSAAGSSRTTGSKAIVALPDQLFYNTGISTYFWIVTNRKRPSAAGKVQLIDARELFVKMRKSLGEKRKEISAEQIDEITRLYGDVRRRASRVKIFPNEAFGFQRITVERPLRLRWEVTDDDARRRRAAAKAGRSSTEHEQLALRRRARRRSTARSTTDRDEARRCARRRSGRWPRPLEKAVWDALAVRDPDAPVITDRKGEPEPDPDLRDNENVPLPGRPVDVRGRPDRPPRDARRTATAIDDYMAAEVLPYVPDAWVDHDKTKIGYEIPLTRHFYKYVPPRPLDEIDAEIKALEAEIQRPAPRGDGVTSCSSAAASLADRSHVDAVGRRDSPRRLDDRRTRSSGRAPRARSRPTSTARADDRQRSAYQLARRWRSRRPKISDCRGSVGDCRASCSTRVVSPAYSRAAVVRPDAAVDPRFVHYLVCEHAAHRTRSRAPRCDGVDDDSAAGRSRETSPCRSDRCHEQRAIADYLDAETARIDALIAKKRRMIELLDTSGGIDVAIDGGARAIGDSTASRLACGRCRCAAARRLTAALDRQPRS